MSRTKKYRIQVPLNPDFYSALDEYCDVSKDSKAAICTFLLDSCTSVLLEMANALREAKTAPKEALQGYADYLKSTVEEANQVGIDLEKAAKKGVSGS